MNHNFKIKTGLLALATVISAGSIVAATKKPGTDILNTQDGQSRKESLTSWKKTGRKNSPEIGTRKKTPRLPLAKAGSTAQKFQSVVTYSDDWDEDFYDSYIGVYTFDSSTPISFKQTFVSDEFTPTGGAFFTDKYYFITTESEDWFTGEISVTTYKLSRNDWDEITSASQDIYCLYNGICYDPIDDVAYGFFYNDEGGAWGYMDLNTLSVTHIRTLEEQVIAIAISEAGEAYAITDSGNLISINKHSGQYTVIGQTGLTPQYMQGATFGTDGKLYWAASTYYTSGLYEVDLKTGKATLVGAFNGTEEVCALYPVYGDPATGAPASVENIVPDVSGDAMTFPLSFKLPSKTYGGSALSGNVSYTIYVDGIQVVSGTGTAGTTVTETLTVKEAGYHVFKITVSNEAGESLPATARKWIGIDQPRAVTGIKIEKTSDTSILLSWNVPDGSVNNGFFSKDRLSYTVIRLPEYKTVASGLKETTFTDNIEIESGQTFVRYLITSYADNVEGIPAESEGVVMGKPYQTPVDFTFDTEEDYNIFTVIDNNETVTLDSGLWLYTPSGEAAGYKSGTKKGDDWLITPSVFLKGGTQYIFSHDVLCYSDNWPEEYSVYMGTAPTIQGMTDEIVPTTTIWWDEYRTKSVIVSVPEDGVYYFGFHATSDAGTAFFLIDNILVRESYNLKAPAAAGEMTVTAGDKGAKTATVAFTVPDKTVDGEAMTEKVTVKVCRNEIAVKTYDNVTPGEKITFEESNVKEGMATYQVICANANGEGPAAESEAWVGFDVPTAPLNAKVVLDKDGHPVISWEAP